MNKSTRHQLHDPRVASLVLCALRLKLCNTKEKEDILEVSGITEAVNSGNSLDPRPTGGTVNLKPNDNIPSLYSIDNPPFDSEAIS
jgi:hypothetical protein